MLHPEARLRAGRERLTALRLRLRGKHPRTRLQPWHEHLAGLSRRLRHSAAARLRLAQSRPRELARALHAVSPLATLERGYAILSNPASGEIVRSTAQAPPGSSLRARVADGEFDVRVGTKP